MGEAVAGAEASEEVTEADEVRVEAVEEVRYSHDHSGGDQTQSHNLPASTTRNAGCANGSIHTDKFVTGGFGDRGGRGGGRGGGFSRGGDRGGRGGGRGAPRGRGGDRGGRGGKPGMRGGAKVIIVSTPTTPYTKPQNSPYYRNPTAIPASSSLAAAKKISSSPRT